MQISKEELQSSLFLWQKHYRDVCNTDLDMI